MRRIRARRQTQNLDLSLEPGSLQQACYDVPDTHADQSAIPALDDLSSAELELEGISTIEGRIELGAVLQGTLLRQ